MPASTSSPCALELDPDAVTTIQALRPCHRLNVGGFLLRETVADYVQCLEVRARDLRRLGLRRPADMPADQPVRLQGGGTLVFDEYGRLKFHVGSGVRSTLQNERLEHLWASGALKPNDQAAGG